MESLNEMFAQIVECEKRINKKLEEIGVDDYISISRQICLPGKENIQKVANEINSEVTTNKWNHNPEYSRIHKVECSGFILYDLEGK